MRGFWERYQKTFDFAKGIAFDDACGSVRQIMDELREVDG